MSSGDPNQGPYLSPIIWSALAVGIFLSLPTIVRGDITTPFAFIKLYGEILSFSILLMFFFWLIKDFSVWADHKFKPGGQIILLLSLSLAIPLALTLFSNLPSAAPAKDDAAPTIYVASVHGDKYHLKSCKYVDNILVGNRVYYSSELEAQQDGKTPCSVCLP